MNPTQKLQRGRDLVMTMPAAIERARNMLRSRLVDFILPNLIGRIDRMRQLRKTAPNDPFFVGLDRTVGGKLIPVLSEPMDDKGGGVALTAPFNLSLPREAALSFVNLLAHVLFLDGLAVSVGFVNVRGHGLRFQDYRNRCRRTGGREQQRTVRRDRRWDAKLKRR